MTTSKNLRPKSAGKNNPNYTHGMRNTRLYNIWRGIKTRCYNKNRWNFEDYGGRGIKMSEEWLRFEPFMKDMYKEYIEHVKNNGEKNTSIDRIDNDGMYCKENCRWSTRKVQNRNRRDTIYYTHNGITLSLKEWSEKTGIPFMTLYNRMFRYKMNDIINK